MCSLTVYEMELMVSEVGYSVFSSIWEIYFSIHEDRLMVCVCVQFYVLLHTCAPVDTVGVCPALFLSIFVPIVCKSVCVCVKINQSGGNDEQFL